MKILPFYVARTAFLAMLVGVFGLWFLQLVFSYLGQLDGLSETYTFRQALRYTLYRSPEALLEFMPTGVLLGAVVGLGALASGNEIAAMRAAGLSVYRLVLWAVYPALFFVGVSLAVNQWVLPHSVQKSHAIKDPKPAALQLRGYWTLNDNGDGSRDIVYIGQADKNGTVQDVRRFAIKDGALTAAQGAKSGKALGADDFRWQLYDVRTVALNAKTHAQRTDAEILRLPISPNAVHLLTKTPDELSITDLYAHKQLMQRQKTRSKAHELAFWQKALSGFSVVSLLLIACSFVFGSLREHSLGFRVVLALLVGLIFHYTQELFAVAALASGWPILPMVALPVVLGAAFGLYGIAKKS